MKKILENNDSFLEYTFNYFNSLDIDFNNFRDSILNKYYEPHRFFHTFENHISFLLIQLRDSFYNTEDADELDLQILLLSVWFHDIVYLPEASTNEEDSIKYMYELLSGKLDENILKQVETIIRDTISHIPTPGNRLSAWFCEKDMLALYLPYTTDMLMQQEDLMFAEFAAIPFQKYQENRIKFLESCKGKGEQEDETINKRIEIVKYKHPNIGIYAGSFNPFTLGHEDILLQALNTFDKVIVLFAHNADKNGITEFYHDSYKVLKSKYKNLQIEVLSTRLYPFITDYIEDLEINTNASYTLIKGLRNGDDLNYEENQIKFLKNRKENLNVVFYLSNTNVKHISSTAVRNLMKISTSEAKKYFLH